MRAYSSEQLNAEAVVRDERAKLGLSGYELQGSHWEGRAKNEILAAMLRQAAQDRATAVGMREAIKARLEDCGCGRAPICACCSMLEGLLAELDRLEREP